MASSSTTAPQNPCHEQHEQQRISPRKKKKTPDDPFLQLPITPLPILTPNGSPTKESHNVFDALSSQQDEPRSSLLTKIVLTPLIMTSFIISLFFVNQRDRASRLSATSSPSLRSLFSPRTWVSPEPYQNPSSSAWGLSSSTAPWHGSRAQSHDDGGVGEKWFIRKKHRKIANLQLGDAFELRRTVVLCMCAVGVMGILGLGWLARWSYAWSFR